MQQNKLNAHAFRNRFLRQYMKYEMPPNSGRCITYLLQHHINSHHYVGVRNRCSGNHF